MGLSRHQTAPEWSERALSGTPSTFIVLIVSREDRAQSQSGLKMDAPMKQAVAIIIGALPAASALVFQAYRH